MNNRNNLRNTGKNTFSIQYISPNRDFRDGYQPSQKPTQQTGESSNNNRPTPPSGGSGVPDKSN
jgi:hypothetical protein